MNKIKIIHKDYDEVVKSVFLVGMANYKFANEKLFPQIDNFKEQRKKLNRVIYEKLERDIKNNCIMPPITVALIREDVGILKEKELSDIENILNENIEYSYVLDGIQRLNVLNKAYSEDIKDRTIYVNVLVSSKNDYLLYRMITLNNGQSPMSARHQIEVLADNIYDFDNLSITTQSEKERSKKRIRGAFNKDLIIKAYIAYLSKNINIDDKKIIESKMDEIIADNIIKSNLTQFDFEFVDIIELIEKFIADDYIHKWFKVENNLIGFSAGVTDSYDFIKNISIEDFKDSIQLFEEAFQGGFNISRIRVGFIRRVLVNKFIRNYEDYKNDYPGDLTTKFSESIRILM